jgi:hypothetical protein
MPSFNIFGQNLFCNVVLCGGLQSCGSPHELLLLPRMEILPGSQQDGWDGGQVGNVYRDDVGCVSGSFLRHSCSGLPDLMDVGPGIDFTHYQIERFPRHPFHRVRGTSPLVQDGSSGVRLG